MQPQIKICGLTDPEQAAQCVELGADAIGLVFYRKSPRFVTDEKAEEIVAAVGGAASVVGVFVNESHKFIMSKVKRLKLDVVQLHGDETPEFVQGLAAENFRTLKCLYLDDTPSIRDAAVYGASAFIVEHKKGKMPGGNALSWNWKEVRDFGDRHPLVLAGGLSAETVSEAVRLAWPDAVDVSSNVEESPGKKDLTKVEKFINTVRADKHILRERQIFG